LDDGIALYRLLIALAPRHHTTMSGAGQLDDGIAKLFKDW